MFSRMMSCPLIVGLILATVAIESIVCMPSFPTIEPTKTFNAEEDAKTLHEAMQGDGADESAIIKVLGHRTSKERHLIAEQYEKDFSRHLLTALKSETSGDFRAAIIGLMSPLERYYARELKNSIARDELDNSTIIDILVPLENGEIDNVAVTYKNLYGKELVDDIMKKTTDTTRTLFESLCHPNRDNDEEVNEEAAVEDTGVLRDAAVGQDKINEASFNAILTTRSFSQLQLILNKYEEITDDSIEDTITAKFSEPARQGYLSIVLWVRNKAAYFAKRLHNALKGKEVNKATLSRIIIGRSEIDLGDIKLVYAKKYGDTLSGDINSYVKPENFRKLLASLLGKRE